MENPPRSDRRYGLSFLISWLSWAWAIPVQLSATVAPNHTIHGTITVPVGINVEDPLKALPVPQTDLTALRTYPGAPDRGEMVIHDLGHGRFSFTTQLPRRLGAIGDTSHGLYALGGFYPQPITDDPLDWTVNVELPALGLVGESVGEGLLTWYGRADRVALALPHQAQLVRIPLAHGEIVVLGKGAPRPALIRNLHRLIPSLPSDLRVVMVEAPLRRRLFRHTAGTGFVSDRIFRLSAPFRPYHRPALLEGLYAAHSRRLRAQERELIGSVRAAEHYGEGSSAGRLTRWLSWIPTVDFLLSSRRMPFYQETFRTTNPSDRLADDLEEVFSPARSGASIAAQLNDRYGHGTALSVVRAMDQGLTLAQALQLRSLDPELAAQWRTPEYPQDYVLTVGADAEVLRAAPAGSPPETVVIEVNGERSPYTLGPRAHVRFEGHPQIRIDPARHTQQTSRMRDAYPIGRFRLTAASWLDIVNLTRFRPTGGGMLSLRGRYDTHNLFTGSLSTSRANLVSLRLGYSYRFGPFRYGMIRQQRLTLSGGPNLIDPSFRSASDGNLSWVGSLSWSWRTTISSTFPLRGRASRIYISGGFFPGSDTRWGKVGASASGVLSFHPRHALAGRFTGTVARATRQDLLPTLGGIGQMRSVPVLSPCGAQNSGRCAQGFEQSAHAALEYRVAVARGMSIPFFGVAWISELQLAAGPEVVAATLPNGPAAGLGGTVGISGVYDLFGADPGLLGFTAAWLLWEEGIDYAPALQPIPELYLRFSQSF